MDTFINPAPFLNSLLGKDVVVRLKWGLEYTGVLVSFDSHMNFHLRNAEEWEAGNNCGFFDNILLRCNNVLHIRKKPENYPSSSVAPIEDE